MKRSTLAVAFAIIVLVGICTARNGREDDENQDSLKKPKPTAPPAPAPQTTTTLPPCNICPCGTSYTLYQPDGCPVCNRCAQPTPNPTKPAPTVATPTTSPPSCKTCPATPKPITTTTEAPTTTVEPNSTPIPTLTFCPICSCGRTGVFGDDGCCICATCPTPAPTCSGCATPQPTCQECACGASSKVSNGCFVCNQCTANQSGKNAATSDARMVAIGTASVLPLLLALL